MCVHMQGYPEPGSTTHIIMSIDISMSSMTLRCDIAHKGEKEFLHFIENLSNVLLCFVVIFLCGVEKGVPDFFLIVLLHIFICL